MSEAMTSPSGGGEGGAVATSGVSDSGQAESTGSIGGGESPELSGQETAPTQTAEASGDSAPALSEETVAPSMEFDVNSWDGNIDSLPEEWREAVRHLHKNLESGYTKKFQSLSEERKTFQADQERWTSEKDVWERSKSDVEGERDLLKRILEGEDDPRIQEFSEANEKLKGDLESIKGEYDSYKGLVDADIEHQAKEFASQFRKKNEAIFESEEKRVELSKFLTAGWEPEIAVKLIGQDEKVITLAAKLAESGTPQEVAVEHALMKSGSAPRTPRPGARITSGAESRNNPASTQSSGLPASNRDARLSAARAAMNWAKEQKLS
jgi:hypothetical protein